MCQFWLIRWQILIPVTHINKALGLLSNFLECKETLRANFWELWDQRLSLKFIIYPFDWVWLRNSEPTPWLPLPPPPLSCSHTPPPSFTAALSLNPFPPSGSFLPLPSTQFPFHSTSLLHFPQIPGPNYLHSSSLPPFLIRSYLLHLKLPLESLIILSQTSSLFLLDIIEAIHAPHISSPASSQKALSVAVRTVRTCAENRTQQFLFGVTWHSSRSSQPGLWQRRRHVLGTMKRTHPGLEAEPSFATY